MSDESHIDDIEVDDRRTGSSASDKACVSCLRDLRSLIHDYEKGVAREWQEFADSFQKRAQHMIVAASDRAQAIRNAADAEQDSVLREHSGPCPQSELDVSPMSLGDIMGRSPFKDHWGKVGFAGLLLGWMLAGFGFGIIAFPVTMIGWALWLRQVQHNSVESRRQEIEGHLADYASDQQTAQDELNAIAAKRDRDLAVQAAALAEHKRPLGEEWAAACAAFNGRIRASQKQLQTILEALGPRVAAFADDDPIQESIADLDEQVAFRLGARAPVGLRRLDKDTAYELELVDRPASLSIPLPVFFDLHRRHALFIEGGTRPASGASPDVFESVMTRVLRQIPPGKATFTLIDPLGLGQNFAPFLKLQDYSDALVSGTVWTSRDQIKKRLRLTIEHIEKVTQKYLRADYPDIEAYNRQAEEIAEPYRFMCVADFPENFDEEAVRDLIKIVQNGPRCGVHTIIYHNAALKPGYGIDLNELRQSCTIVGAPGDGPTRQVSSSGGGDRELVLDDAPRTEYIKKLVDSFGAGAIDAMKVEVPFSALAGLAGIEADRWTQTSTDGIVVPLGPVGAKKALTMMLDSRLSHNALIVGRPGSGKSNLLHVFIAMVSRRYAPDEVELYLVDFKKGVEFKDYANALLPHARVIAVESEREFGLSVLRAIDKEMTARADLFKRANAAENIIEYRKAEPDARMPRAVLIVDEFQEFFTRDDKIKTEATLLLDRIVRQGRSFGIHVILGTQSLANSGLPRSTIDQIPIRIALQCSEADSRLILADDNIVARGLSRPGEAIYNNKGGLVEGNNQFQVAMFGGGDRKKELAELRDFMRDKRTGDPPRIFEGHEPAQLITCKPLLRFAPTKVSGTLKMWLGEPVSLDDPVFATLSPQAGRNMMVIAREEEQGTNVLLAALASLAAQLPPRDLNIRIVDLTTADARWADFPENLRDAMPHGMFQVCGRQGIRDLLPELRRRIKQRQDLQDESSDSVSDTGPRTILAIIGAHRARELRAEEAVGYSAYDEPADGNPSLARSLREIVTDGPDHGVHTLMWLDSVTSFERIFERRVLNEFGIRVSGPLPEKDSNTLYESQIAAQIQHPNRMVKFDDDMVGVYTLFRPYAVQSEDTFTQIRDQMFAESQGGK